MRKSLLMLSILFLILLATAPVWAVIPNQPAGSKTDSIMNDMTKDFQLFSDLLTSHPGNIHNRAEAIAWLSPGFGSQLAASIVDCYLQPDPELNGMTVIATDSIPVITDADRNFCQITQLDAGTARVDRIYSSCYTPGDRWLYQVTVKKSERWKIIDISLIPLTLTCFPSNP